MAAMLGDKMRNEPNAWNPFSASPPQVSQQQGAFQPQGGDFGSIAQQIAGTVAHQLPGLIMNLLASSPQLSQALRQQAGQWGQSQYIPGQWVGGPTGAQIYGGGIGINPLSGGYGGGVGFDQLSGGQQFGQLQPQQFGQLQPQQFGQLQPQQYGQLQGQQFGQLHPQQYGQLHGQQFGQLHPQQYGQIQAQQ